MTQPCCRSSGGDSLTLAALAAEGTKLVTPVIIYGPLEVIVIAMPWLFFSSFFFCVNHRILSFVCPVTVCVGAAVACSYYCVPLAALALTHPSVSRYASNNYICMHPCTLADSHTIGAITH